ncbi:TPR-like protein [Dendrothele bispora CBS 962.96]|uniref:TPR-like protein n=1 Tax=Dendrothele bispora (strain CBS 962.96) TaxID=1314807 RepID=A0A4S8KP35_DENBC|nr:TPR-like protein [Dendrothele bispora CBS 962.96]
MENAILVSQQAVDLSPDGHAHKAALLNNLGSAFFRRFNHLGELRDVENAILVNQQAVDLAPDGHADKAALLHNLGNALLGRFRHLGELEDIKNAILVKKQAVDLIPDGHVEKAGLLNNLGAALLGQFERLGKLEDIENAILVIQQAVNLTPDGHAHKVGWLGDLGYAFFRRFECLGKLEDIENAILIHQQAVDMTPDGHTDKAGRLINLGNAFFCRFKRLGERRDMENAILVNQQAVDLTPDGHADKAIRLSDLGNVFQSRFERLGELGDMENAILVKQQAVDLTPDGHAHKATLLSNLGSAFFLRFEHLGELRDIENAILVHQRAIDLTPDGHASKAALLDHLGDAFNRRFDRFGKLEDIENAILLHQQAVDLTHDGHAGKAAQLDHLGTALQTRFERLGELRDMENAILVHQQAVDLTPDGHAGKAELLNNLSNAFFHRFNHLGKLRDIDNAILIKQQVVDLTPDGHTDKAGRLNNLGNAFISRFERLGELRDIENAILVNQQAVDLTPDGHALKAAWLNSLGNAFSYRFEQLGELRDMENAILVHQQAVDLTPDDHALKAAHLSNLGSAFFHRFKQTGKLDDIENAIVAFKKAAGNTSSPPLARYTAASVCALLSSIHHSPSSALDAYTVALEIIPQLVWLGQTVHRRYKELPRIGMIINNAIAMAISVGDLLRAVEWLEEGRSIVWKQILQLRTPLDELRQQHPDIADDLSRVSLALDNAGTFNFQNIDLKIKHKNLEEEAQNHRKLATKYEELLQQVRELDGFSSFLRPKKFSELSPVARNGPVVVVNAAALRCDALVLCTSGEIVPVPLSTFSYEQAETLHLKLLSSLQAHGVRVNRNDLAMRSAEEANQDIFISVLADLWSHVVQPILSEIEQVLHENAHDSLPHITWCATGALAFLPLHAAGIYGSDNLNINISDFAVSSYTTTLTAMLGFSSKPRRDSTIVRSVLIVSQPATPGQPHLPDVVKEVEAIQRYTSPDHTCHLTHELATVGAVLGEMSKHEIIHLACHGIQNMQNPLSSAFLLYDGGLELSTLMRLSLENAELAVLSACETATGDENLPEEAVHLAAGMLAVGYPSVIATMWPIGDADAPLIADKVYANILGHRDNSESPKANLAPAYALHAAVKHLREEVGETNFVRWVPFIHFGV